MEGMENVKDMRGMKNMQNSKSYIGFDHFYNDNKINMRDVSS